MDLSSETVAARLRASLTKGDQGDEADKATAWRSGVIRTNQNSWIAVMKEEWKKSEYKDIPLVASVCGDDQYDRSYREMQGLVKGWSEPTRFRATTPVMVVPPGPWRQTVLIAEALHTSRVPSARS